MEQSEQNLLNYSLKELCNLAEISERTVRYYITEGLLPPSHGSGLAASYSQYHLYMLLVIRWMKNQYLPLAEIKQRLLGLSLVELKEIAQQAAPAQVAQIAQPQSSSNALDYLAQLRANQKFGAANPARPCPPPVPAQPLPPSQTNWPPVTPPGREEGESWQRITLAPDIELHYRPQTTQPERQAKIKQLLEQARQLFQN